MKLKQFIDSLRDEKEKWLSFYIPGEIIQEKVFLPKTLENQIQQINFEVIDLLSYLYKNFFEDILSYLGYGSLEKISFESFNLFHRYDLFFDVNGNPKIVEFNMDVAGGHLETIILNDLSISELFLRNLIDGFRKKFVDGTIAIVVSTSYREDYKIACFLQKVIETFLNRQVFIISPVQLQKKGDWLYYENTKIDNLLRYYPWDRFLPSSFRVKTNILNPEHSFIFQQKKLFSFMWENIDKFDKKIQKIIAKLIPYSLSLNFFSKDRLFLEKNKWVIKHTNKREGIDVFIGQTLEEKDWKKVLKKVFKSQNEYIVQEKIDFVNTQDGFNLNFGVYNVNFNYSGIYLRLHKKIKTDITSFVAGIKFE